MSRITKHCVDCGKVFQAWSDLQVRCPECQREHRRKKDRERKRDYYETRRRERKTNSMVVNGHVQVCDVLHKCFYGSDSRSGCAYAIEERETRRSRGLWIVDGKCPAYRPKKKSDTLRRSKLSMVNNGHLSNREVYHKFNET